MEFTYNGYGQLILLLKNHGFAFWNYHDYADELRGVILRHDIDYSPETALCLGRVEETLGVSSTYFVLLTSDFYNPASTKNLAELKELQNIGHEIGLHFDEMAYGGTLSTEQMVGAIQKEALILSEIIGTPVTTVSMHRPSKATLEADLKIPDMINSYGQTFFHDFKYVSDSRRRWREPVEDIIRSGEYDRLHILTHAFWYHEREAMLKETIGNFIHSANHERYEQMRDNITDLASIIPEME